jgi:hypothetical protein
MSNMASQASMAQQWEQGCVVLPQLSRMLGIALDERVEWADADPITGDYRVYAIAWETGADGSSQLWMELHRQAPSFQPHIFSVLRAHFSSADAQGMAILLAFHSDAGLQPAGFARYLSPLALIVAHLRERKTPEDAWLTPLLCRSGNILWAKSVIKWGAA